MYVPLLVFQYALIFEFLSSPPQYLAVEEGKFLEKYQSKVFFIGAGPGDPELITVKGPKII